MILNTGISLVLADLKVITPKNFHPKSGRLCPEKVSAIIKLYA